MSMRISGLASGMDVDALVKDMMKPVQIRMDRVMQQKTRSEWIQEAYNDLNATLARFVLDRTTDLGLIRSSTTGLVRSSDNLDWLKAAASSDTDVADVTANASAVVGSFDIKVERLAANWAAASTSALPELGTNPDGSPMLNTLANQFSLDSDTAVVDFVITTSKGAVRVTSDSSATETEGVHLVKIDLDIHSLQDVAYQLNSANVGVKASYDASIRRFFLQTASSGSANTLRIDDNSTGLGLEAGFLAAPAGESSVLKLADKVAGTISGEVYAGVDALVDIGAAQGITQSNNNFSVNGVNFSLHSLGEATIQVSTDVDTAFAKIKKFVEDYNKLLSDLQTKLSEKYDKDYQPLTDEQRAVMSEDQIKQWEAKAKTGLLARSGEISQMVSAIRSDMFLSVKGVAADFNALTKIGISTGAYSMDGKLVVDETKLKKALGEDADSVVRFLFQTPPASVTDEKEYREQSGVVNRLFKSIINGMKSIVDKAGTGNNASLYRSVQTTILVDFVADKNNISVLDRDLSDYSKMLLRLDDRFVTTQARYYRQFTAMEQAIQRANAQSAWLAQQFAGANG